MDRIGASTSTHVQDPSSTPLPTLSPTVAAADTRRFRLLHPTGYEKGQSGMYLTDGAVRQDLRLSSQPAVNHHPIQFREADAALLRSNDNKEKHLIKLLCRVKVNMRLVSRRQTRQECTPRGGLGYQIHIIIVARTDYMHNIRHSTAAFYWLLETKKQKTAQKAAYDNWLSTLRMHYLQKDRLHKFIFLTPSHLSLLVL